VWELERSPKKKKRKDMKGKRKTKEKEKETASILKPGQFSPALNNGKQATPKETKQTVETKRKLEWEQHGYKHARAVLVCSVVCS